MSAALPSDEQTGKHVATRNLQRRQRLLGEQIQLLDSPACIGRSPFLVWPVARREFYASISFALLPTLAWGLIIFGWRSLMVVAMTLSGAVTRHLLLERLTKRGRFLVLAHTVVSALLIGALASPIWPWPMMAAAGAFAVVIIWLLGGPGHEWVHPAFLVALLLVVGMHWTANSAILVRDRLVTGDVTKAEEPSQFSWPLSVDVGGAEAVRIKPPTVSLLKAFSEMSQNQPDSNVTRQHIDALISGEFPWPSALLFGLFPGPIGVVSGIGVMCGGFFLVYRNILRPYSCAFFLGCVFLALLVSPLSWQAVREHGWHSFAGVFWGRIDESFMLTTYELWGSDVLFAAVFVLAMPGTLPITRPGRRWFLAIAGVTIAFVHRLVFPTPVATFVLLAMQPLAPWFDRWLARGSWLDG